MPSISLTRLRIRSFRYMPLFGIYTTRSLQQVRKAPGVRSVKLLPDRSFTFWTMTAWDSREDMLRYMISGPHKAAMPRLMQWCDEASVAHWEQEDSVLPSWEQADRRMREMGRPSKLRYPSPNHADLTYRAPRTSLASPEMLG